MGWLIYGAGDHAKVVIELLEGIEEKIDYMFDDSFEGGLYEGHPTGHYTEGLFPMSNLIIAIANNNDRKRIAEKMKDYNPTSLFHPSSVVSPRADIGDGTLVLANAVVQVGAKLGKFCLINIGAMVDHGAVIGDFVQIAPRAFVASGAEIGEGALIGAGAVINQHVKVPAWTVVPAGTVLTVKEDDKAQ